MENDTHYFYVLKCREGSLYAGYTNDLDRRVRLHNEGKAAKYTRGRGPVVLVYHQVFSGKTEAMRAEYQFKQLSRKKKEDFLMKETGDLDVAAKEL